jgi:hypothetical protein
LKKSFKIFMVLKSVFFVAMIARGHTASNDIGSYTNNEDLSRIKGSGSLLLDFDHQGGSLTSTIYNFMFSQERNKQGEEGDDLYEKSTTNTGSFQAFQIWNKLLETRQSLAVAKEGDVNVASGGFGVSQWLHHETYRISLDLNKTTVKKPTSEYLDVDSNIVMLQERVDSETVTVGLRQLATTTTIVDYGASVTTSTNRPDAKQYDLGLKQFIPPLDAAIHLNGSKYDNRGQVGLNTSEGSLEGQEATFAWLQNLWDDASGRVAYRYYREDETTRAYGDELTFGSDTVTFGISQKFSLGTKRAFSDYKIHAAMSRYITNTDIKANIYEIGLGSTF